MTTSKVSSKIFVSFFVLSFISSIIFVIIISSNISKYTPANEFQVSHEIPSYATIEYEMTIPKSPVFQTKVSLYFEATFERFIVNYRGYIIRSISYQLFEWKNSTQNWELLNSNELSVRAWNSPGIVETKNNSTEFSLPPGLFRLLCRGDSENEIEGLDVSIQLELTNNILNFSPVILIGLCIITIFFWLLSFQHQMVIKGSSILSFYQQRISLNRKEKGLLVLLLTYIVFFIIFEVGFLALISTV